MIKNERNSEAKKKDEVRKETKSNLDEGNCKIRSEDKINQFEV